MVPQNHPWGPGYENAGYENGGYEIWVTNSMTYDPSSRATNYDSIGSKLRRPPFWFNSALGKAFILFFQSLKASH